MVEVLALSRAGIPFERRLTHSEAKTHTFLDPDFDAKSTWLVWIGDEAVGFGDVNVDSNRISAGRNDGRMDIDIVPAHRREGIEEELLARSLAYLRSRGVSSALVRCYADDQWKVQFLRSNSFVEYYRVHDLVRRSHAAMPSAELPPGFSIQHKPFSEFSDDELVAVTDAFNESFLDHFNFAPELPERFINWRNATGDPMLITTVTFGETIVGVCISEESALFNKEQGVRIGWINIVGVVPQHRRLGLARAMLVDGIEWILSRGMDAVYIGVISDNEKALGLYKSLGFEKEHESLWLKRVLAVASQDSAYLI